MKKLIAAVLVIVLALSMAATVSAAPAPQFSYELLLTDQDGVAVNNIRSLTHGDILNVEIVLNRKDLKSNYNMYGIEFQLATRGLQYNGDGESLRSDTPVRKVEYSDGTAVGFAWYDMHQKGESVESSLTVASWSYTVIRPATVSLDVPVSLVYVKGHTADIVPEAIVHLELDANGGKLREDISGEYIKGTTVVLPKVSREGYAFAGWDDGYASYYPGTEITLNTSTRLQATWILENPNWNPDYSVDDLNTATHINYVVGYPDGTILPQSSITRAEVATIFYRLLTDEARAKYESGSNDFPDVMPNMWHNKAVSTLSNAGVITGYPDGNFYPNRLITRAELAAIIDRLAEANSGEVSFFDVDGHWAYENIATAEHNGWINGYPDGSFRPNRSITRAETFAVVNRLLGRFVNDVDCLLDGMQTFSDNNNTSAWYYFDVQEATNNHLYQRLYGSKYEKWTRLLENIQY